MKKWFIALTIILAVGVLAACGGKDNAGPKEDTKNITIGATAGPFTDMVTKAIQPGLEEKGYKVKVVEFSDYIQPNNALSTGEIDANVFQNLVYMETFAEQNKLELSEVITVPTSPMVIFSNKFNSLDEITDGATLALPNDPTNMGRALLILEQEGLITLKDDVSHLTISEKDIKDNVKNIKFQPLEAGQLPRAVESTDMAAVPGNFAFAAKMNTDEGIAIEDMKDVFRNRVVIDTKNVDAQFAKDMKEVVESKGFEDVIDKEFVGFTKPEWMESR
ncbi:MetQ/NlpA family ABC transporter substrate-binding protein [Bacillus sp. FSL K6-3431]|uniref:MetQ/NlpA family ABC transporter substrate-binding protein n=1 Tax=Bacillus sp. FSL K6-3431 TaxID=2921500 RepID=UPI0030FC3EC3